MRERRLIEGQPTADGWKTYTAGPEVCAVCGGESDSPQYLTWFARAAFGSTPEGLCKTPFHPPRS